MTLLWLGLGVFAQIAFAGFQAMLVIFSAGGISNRRELTPFQDWVFVQCMWLLPTISLGTAVLLIYLHVTRSPYFSHAWHLLPVSCSGLYLGYAMWVGR